MERVEKVPSRPSCPQVAGVVIHTATEAVDHLLHQVGYPHGEVPEREDLLVAAQLAASNALTDALVKFSEHYPVEQWQRYGRSTQDKPNAEDMVWWRNVGIPYAMEAYIDWRLGQPQFQLAEVPGFGPAIEVPFNHYMPDGALIHGFIDRVFKNADSDTGGYVALDIKSGAKPKTDEQLGLYAAALQSGLGWNVTWGYYVYGLKSGVAKLTPPLNLTHWSNNKLFQVYGPANLAINQELFTPNPGEACWTCSVSEHCSFAQASI